MWKFFLVIFAELFEYRKKMHFDAIIQTKNIETQTNEIHTHLDAELILHNILS